jgi:hypothetical protein
MAYNDNPTGSDADLVRLKAGDIGSPSILSDEAIEAFLVKNNNNIDLAAADAAESLAAYFSQNQVNSEAEINAAQTRTNNFLKIADRLRSRSVKPRRPAHSSEALARRPLFFREVANGGSADD